ncbi:MAG: hypothetical protein AAF035_10325 [Pseudomonadota bacterium]
MTLTAFALAMVFTRSVATVLSLHRDAQNRTLSRVKNRRYFDG